MQSVTGSGKTRTAAHIVNVYTSTSRQVLWLVHREELLMQASMVFAENRIEHMLICSASSMSAIKCQQVREFGEVFVRRNSHPVTASIHTLVSRLYTYPWLDPKQIIADEAHLSAAATWVKIISRWPSARLLGLTATPCRLDKKPFDRKQGGMYDVLIKGPYMHELIKLGNLAKFKVYAPPLQLNSVKLRRKGGDFLPKDLEAELDGPVIYGDVVHHYEMLSKGKPAIGFCPTVESAKKFADIFQAAGYNAVYLDGTTDDAVRRMSLQKLGRGEIDILFSVSILVEGTDVPYATTVLLLRRTESLALYLQAIGRVLRPHPDKEHAIILDFVGNVLLHGMPDEPREWSLSGDVRSSRAASQDQEMVKIKSCPKCFSIHNPAPKCPECGHVYEVKAKKPMKQVDGALVEMTPEMEARIAEQKSKRREQGHAQSLEDLLELAKIRGHKPSWAHHVFNARRAKSQVA